MNPFKLLKEFIGKPYPKGYNDGPKSVTETELIQRESEVGSTVFGFVAPNRSRQFFNLDANTWIWYEAWEDHKGKHAVTTRYEIHGDNVLKIQDDRPAELVRGGELENLYQATKAYYYKVAAEVYRRPIPQ